ncbi:hypothetical protein [Bdellovibrio sp. HCB2-146]|uniref:hypothetical protein n=1 Tax=Bdellovibrio sp. HCB2-146 TaxID=3394362 RepID=UPI0039BD903A
MKPNKIVSLAVATALTISSSLSVGATSIKQYNKMTTQELQAQLKYARTEMKNVEIQSRSNDELLTILEKEQYMTPLQSAANVAIKGGVLAAIVSIPLYLVAKIEVEEGLNYEKHLTDQKRLESQSWQKALDMHRDFLNELRAGLDESSNVKKGTAPLREKLLSRIIEISSKYEQSVSTIAVQNVEAILAYAQDHTQSEKMVMEKLAYNMGLHAHRTPEIQSELSKSLQKYRLESNAMMKKKLGLLILAIGGGSWWLFKNLSSDLSDEDDITYDIIKEHKRNDNTDAVQGTIDREILKRAALGEKAVRLQEDIVKIETVLMMRGESVVEE